MGQACTVQAGKVKRNPVSNSGQLRAKRWTFACQSGTPFRTPRRFAFTLRNPSADRSWSARAPAPLSHRPDRFLAEDCPTCLFSLRHRRIAL
jgi:hypothetical protein